MNETPYAINKDPEPTADSESAVQVIPASTTQGPARTLVLRAQRRASEQAHRVVPSGPALVARNAFD